MSANENEAPSGLGPGRTVALSVRRARETDVGAVLAICAVALPNEASAALHRALGFAPVGTFEQAGRKLGAWHDVLWWRRRL